jgi:hypothetical protein
VPTLRFPLVGSYTNRKVNPVVGDTVAQRFVNCFPEIEQNPLTGNRRIWLNKRQGTTASSDVQASATGQFGTVVKNNGTAVFSYLKSGGASMMFFTTAGQVGADVGSTNGCVFMSTTDISGTENLTATLVEAGNVYEAWYYPAAGSWTEITDSDFPKSTLTPTHTHMDGYMFVMTTTGRIHNSEVNSLSSWLANSYITANSAGDPGVGVARYKNFIVGFGGVTTEFFVNNGNSTGSVLKRVPDMTFSVGALATSPAVGTSIREVGDTIYWIGKNADTGKKGIYRLNGGKPEKISNDAIDRFLHIAVLGYVLGSFSLYGQTFVAFSLAANTVAVCYSVETGFWWYLTPAGSLNLTSFAGEVTNTATDSYFVTSSNAKIYNFDSITPVWQDNASAYTMTVQTDNIDCDTDRLKFWDRLRLVYDRQSAASNVGVSWSDDDGANFSTEINIDTNTDQSWITALGASSRRIWRFTHAANSACRLAAVEIDYTLEPMAVAA